jgi:hypothetical protein
MAGGVTLRSVAEQLGVSPVDITGDAALAAELLDSDISDTVFYQDIREEL